MTDYSNWKIEKSVINYTGQDEEKQKAAQAAQDEYTAVAEWCNDNPYTIEETEKYYQTVFIPEPEPHIPTYEEVRQMRIRYRREHIDDQTAERTRKQANSTWTDDDEAAYLALDAEVTAYIEEHFPYPVEE
jgi:hypothetical protein